MRVALELTQVSRLMYQCDMSYYAQHRMSAALDLTLVKCFIVWLSWLIHKSDIHSLMCVMAHVALMNQSWHAWMHHGIHGWVMSHVCMSRATHEWVSAHLCMSHGTHEWVLTHIFHDTHKCVMMYMDESWHTWTSHNTHRWAMVHIKES